MAAKAAAAAAEEEGKVQINVLNAPAATSPLELALQLNKAIMRIYGRFLDEQGLVDYAGIKNSPEFADFVVLTRDLRDLDLSSLDADQLKCVVLNLYNALVIHGNVVLPPCKDIKAKLEFFKTTAYNIGGHLLTLDNLEHGILRCNHAHPTTGARQFPLEDPRAALAMEKTDPRIHFALVCGAKGCPPIRIFRMNSLERGLEAAAVGFCDRECQVDVANKKVTLSKIFDWYGKDMAEDTAGVLRFIANYLKGDKKEALEKILADSSPDASDIHVEYTEYDWSLNQSEGGGAGDAL